MAYGSQQNYVLIGRESTKGTAVACTKDLGIINDPSIGLSREVIEVKGISSPQAQQIVSGMNDVKGNLTLTLQHGRILELALGGVAHANTGSDTTHTFTVTSDLPSSSLEYGLDGSTDTVATGAGIQVESLEIGIALNGLLTGSVAYRGMVTASTATAQSAVVSTLVAFPHSLCHVTLNGGEATEVQNASVTFENIIKPVGGISSNNPQGIVRTEVSVKVKAQLAFNSKTYWEKVQGGSSLATGVPTTDTFTLQAHNAVTLGSGRREITVTVNQLIYDTAEMVAAVGDLVFLNVSGTGILSACQSVDNITSANWA